MKKIVIFTCLLLSLSLAGSSFAAVLIDLDAADLPEGDLSSWTNEGTAGGEFLSADGHYNADNEFVPDPNAVVEIVDGLKAVSFADGAWMQSDIPAPNELSEANPWTVMAWAYNADQTNQDTLFQFADRDDPEGDDTAQISIGNGYAFIGFGPDLFYEEGPPEGLWFHIAVTYDGTDMTFYINGLEDFTGDASELFVHRGDPMRIARALPDVWGTQPLTGSIASLQVHDEVLSLTQIQEIANVFPAGSLSPIGLRILEGGTSEDITLQINVNPLTGTGPASDLEVTLSFAGDFADAQLGTSAVGDPFVVTVPAASYSDPITVSIVAEDDVIQEGQHNVIVQAEITGGDPNYLGQPITPFNGLAVTLSDNDFDPCPAPAFSNGSYTDHFDCSWDFGQGPTGMWDGLMNAENVLSINSNVTSPGQLYIESTGNWNGNETTGPFLYTEVTGDFKAEIHMDPPITSGPNGGGLMVRLGGDLALGGDGEDNMLLYWMPGWDVGSIFWPVDDGVRPELDITWDGVDAPSYLRVERQGANFYWSRSYDGENWEMLPSASPRLREDMNVETLQVGVVQAFGSEDAYVQYDYFKLAPTRGTISGTLNLTESIGESGTVELQLDPAGFPAPLADIDVTVSAVVLEGGDPNTDPNDIAIGTALKGEPYAFTIPAVNYDQPQLIDVAAVIDADPELDQLLSLATDCNSTDPNWSGIFITSKTAINVLEVPGLAIETGDGIEVSEGGSTDTFTVELKTMPTAAVTVTIVDADQVAAIAPLSFDDTNFMTPQIVTLAAIDDATLETDPHSTTLTLASSNGAEYDGLGGSVSVSILENECGAWGYNWADFDEDCDVDIADLQTIAAAWLDCSNPYDPGCIDYR